MEFYGHKLKDFGSKKSQQWQKVNNGKGLNEEQQFALYDIFRKRTKGGVLDEVRRLRDKNVKHTRGKIAELLGMETYDDNKQLEDQLSLGIVNTQTDSDGNIINIGSTNEIERQSGSMGQESCKITRKNW